MPERSMHSNCTVTAGSGNVVVKVRGMAAITLSPARAVEISNCLLHAAAAANGRSVFDRG